MQLIEVRYEKDKVKKTIIGIVLVEHKDRYSILRSDKLSVRDAAIIKQHSKILDDMKIEDKIAWFKKNIKEYGDAYRDLKKEFSTVTNIYNI